VSHKPALKAKPPFVETNLGAVSHLGAQMFRVKLDQQRCIGSHSIKVRHHGEWMVKKPSAINEPDQTEKVGEKGGGIDKTICAVEFEDRLSPIRYGPLQDAKSNGPFENGNGTLPRSPAFYLLGGGCSSMAE